jgi:hypothetical protein
MKTFSFLALLGSAAMAMAVAIPSAEAEAAAEPEPVAKPGYSYQPTPKQPAYIPIPGGKGYMPYPYPIPPDYEYDPKGKCNVVRIVIHHRTANRCANVFSLTTEPGGLLLQRRRRESLGRDLGRQLLAQRCARHGRLRWRLPMLRDRQPEREFYIFASVLETCLG